MRAIVVTAVISVLCVTATGRADEKEKSPIDGHWQMVEGIMGGQAFPADLIKDITLTINGNKYVSKAEGPDEGTIKYIPNTSPKAMEIKGTEGPNKDKTLPAIYELKGDKLIICYDLSGKARPKEFKSTAGTQLFLATYKKAKP
jgi:uncharacterized protein (TIGR03067 family)